MLRSVAIFALSYCFAAAAWGAPDDSTPSTPLPTAGSSVADLRSAARDLASPQFRRRQRAHEQLLAAGELAIPALAEAVASPDREARSRALAILVAFSASRNERLAVDARQTLDRLASRGKGTAAGDVQMALASARMARIAQAIEAIRAGGGTVTSDQGEEQTLGGPLSVKIDAFWKRGSSDLKLLAEVPTTTWLSLEGSPIDDGGLVYVGQIHDLEKLFLKGTRVRGPGLARLKNLTKLVHLSLRELPLTDEGLAQLPALPQLAYLGLDNTQVTDAGLVELKRFAQLDTLWLDNTSVTDAALLELAPLHHLRTLYLAGTRCSGPGLASLKGVSSLRFLSLKGVELSPASTRHLAELSQLETLGLDHTNVTDQQLAHLDKLTRLKVLWLSKTPVTDDGIKHLTQLKSLQEVYFHGSQVTAAGRQALRAALPECRVEPNDDRPDRTRRRN
jgi:hypothetical protein